MKVLDILHAMDIGSSVAEFDTHLQQYFLKTHIYTDFVRSSFDIVAGDKGTGKSAIYRVVKDRNRDIPELKNIELISGFNDAGNPIFQRLTQADILSEAKYITIWKIYLLSLVGNYLLDVCEGSFSTKMERLDRLLNAIDLRTKDPSASTVFSQLSNLIRRLCNPKSAEVSVSVTESGMPVVIPKVEFGDIAHSLIEKTPVINSDSALEALNDAIADFDIDIWVVLDRLDEAFAGYPSVEIPALRALFRTYLDCQAYPRLKLKLFVRNDLFRKIVKGGFVNLTHVNAKRIQIDWSNEDIYALLCNRLKNSSNFMKLLGLDSSATRDDIFSRVFPNQIDIGYKKPTTWNWIIARIKDSNGTIPPRNLIDLVNKSREEQIRREERDPREFCVGTPIFEPESLRKGLDVLSDQRVQDTLIAESGEIADFIEKFRNGKAEHNRESLKNTIGCDEASLDGILQELRAIGFLEALGESFKIPMIYRGGLNITQGKAFG